MTSVRDPLTVEDLAEAVRDLRQAIERQTDLLAGIHQQIVASTRPAPRLDPTKAAQLLRAIAGAIGNLDLSFTAREIVAHATVDHRLALALEAVGATDCERVGWLFRSLRGRQVGGWELRRDGRLWVLVRRCT